MKKARIYKKENGKVKYQELFYNFIIYKENYVVISSKETHIIRNFENIICDSDDFRDLEYIMKK